MPQYRAMKRARITSIAQSPPYLRADFRYAHRRQPLRRRRARLRAHAQHVFLDADESDAVALQLAQLLRGAFATPAHHMYAGVRDHAAKPK